MLKWLSNLLAGDRPKLRGMEALCAELEATTDICKIPKLLRAVKLGYKDTPVIDILKRHDALPAE